jgi:hypothetical protein
MPALKNQRQEIFSQNLTKGMTGDEAYIQAGYKPNRHNASRLKANETIKNRIAEIRQETAQALILERQSVITALLDNVEKALGRRPVKIGEEGREVFVYRGDVVNSALKMAGAEIGLFTNKSEVSHRRSRSDDLSDTNIVRMLRDEAQLLLEHHEREAREGGEADGNGE